MYSVGVERAGVEVGRALGLAKGVWEEFERGVDGGAPGGNAAGFGQYGREL